jgi:hypothetical protein
VKKTTTTKKDEIHANIFSCETVIKDINAFTDTGVEKMDFTERNTSI